MKNSIKTVTALILGGVVGSSAFAADSAPVVSSKVETAAVKTASAGKQVQLKKKHKKAKK